MWINIKDSSINLDRISRFYKRLDLGITFEIDSIYYFNFIFASIEDRNATYEAIQLAIMQELNNYYVINDPEITDEGEKNE